MTGRSHLVKHLSLVLVVVLLAIWPRQARSEASVEDQARAQELFESGLEAAQAEDFGAAIDAFSESYTLYPHPGTLLNLGLYQLRAGRRVDAYGTLRDLMSRYRTVLSDRARSEVDQRLQELQSALAVMVVTTRPLGATIRINGADQGETPLDSPVAFEPGSYTFEASLTEWIPESETHELNAGETGTIELELSPELPDVRPPASLIVSSRTVDARISIDGSPSELLPIRRQLEVGDHELVIEAPEHISQTRALAMPDVGEVTLEVELVRLDDGSNGEPRRPVWPWIVGSVVVLGVSAAIAVPLLANREPDPDWTMRVR